MFRIVSDCITNGRVTEQNNSRKESREEKLPTIIEEEVTEESFDQLRVVCAKRQETKLYSHCFICNEKNQ